MEEFILSSNSVGIAYDQHDSCIGQGQRLLTVAGNMPAGEILRRFRAGRWVGFWSRHPVTGEVVPNRVVAAIPTYSRGKTIVFADGRRVTLTGSHALPHADPTFETWGEDWNPHPFPVRCEQCRYVAAERPILEGNWDRPWGAPIPKYKSEHPAFDPITAGDILGDGLVSEVIDLGKIEAVRLWTAFPAWLLTDDHLRVGSRWHETASAFVWMSSPPYHGGKYWEGDFSDPRPGVLEYAVTFPAGGTDEIESVLKRGVNPFTSEEVRYGYAKVLRPRDFILKDIRGGYLDCFGGPNPWWKDDRCLHWSVWGHEPPVSRLRAITAAAPAPAPAPMVVASPAPSCVAC